MSDCQELKQHADEYALGALEGPERDELEAHLARGCPTCTSEVERARWLVAQLAYLAAGVEPSASLRRRVLEAAGHAAPRPWIPYWAWAAAMALLAVTAFSTYWTHRMQSELTALRIQIEQQRSQSQQLQSERERYERALAVLAAAGTKEVALTHASGTSLPDVYAYWNAELGVVVKGLQVPAPAAHRTFQLWVVPKKGNPISAGVFRPDAEGKVLHVSKPEAELSAASALAITDEPEGGRPRPTTKPLWVGPVS